MKRIVCIAMVLTMALASLTAQNMKKGKAPNGKERIQLQTNHYIELFGLDKDKAADFTRIYRDYSKKMHAIHTSFRSERPKEGEQLTEEQIEQQLLNNFAQSKAILDAREKYYKEFRAILLPSQIQTIYKDEKNRMNAMRKRAGRPDGKTMPDGKKEPKEVRQ